MIGSITGASASLSRRRLGRMLGLTSLVPAAVVLPGVAEARCDYPDDRDSAGRRCGRRAASVRKGGRLGGTE